MPVDLRNIFSGFLVLMSDGLYDAYQFCTQRPDFVNRDLGYLIAQEMKQSTDIAAVAQNVVKKVKQLYRSTCKKNGHKGRIDDITLIIRNLHPSMTGTTSWIHLILIVQESRQGYLCHNLHDNPCSRCFLWDVACAPFVVKSPWNLWLDHSHMVYLYRQLCTGNISLLH